ncbi:MAG: translocation/assembly module TamB domain-containing protein [Pseudomonadota bacterium]
MSRWRLWLTVLLSVLVLAAGVVFTALGTEAGTRWLWAQAKPLLPHQLSVKSVGGTLLSELVLEDILWQDDAVAVSVARTRVQLELAPLLNATVSIDAMRLDDVDVRISESSDEPQSDVPLAIDLPIRLAIKDAELVALTVQQSDDAIRSVRRIAFALDWAGTELDLPTLELDSDWLELSAAGGAEIAPPYATDVTGRWRLQHEEWRNPGGSFSLQGSSDEYTLQHQLSTPVAVTSEARLENALNEWRAVIENRWDSIEWAFDDGTVVRSPEGEIVIDATASAYSASGQTVAVLADGSMIPLTVSVDGTRDALTIERLSASHTFGDFETSGRVDLNSLSWSMDARLENGQLGGLSGALDSPFSVRTLVEGQVLDRDSVRAEVTARDVIGQIGALPLTGSVSAGLEWGTLSSVVANLSLDNSTVSLDANIGERVSADLEFRIDDLSLIEGISGGSAAGSAVVSGLRVDPSLTLAASAQGVVFGSLSVDEMEANFAGTATEHQVRFTADRLGQSIEVAAAGGLLEETWRGVLKDFVLRNSDGTQWAQDDAVSVVVAPDLLTIERFCVRSSESLGNVCAEINRDADASIHATVDGTALPLEPFAVVMPERLEPNGSLSIGGDLRFADGAVNGDIELGVQNGSLSTEYAGETLSTDFTARGAAQLSSNRLTSTMDVRLDGLGGVEGGASLADVFDADAALSGRFAIDVDDLSIVSVLLPDVQSPGGRLSGEVSLAGTRLQPQFLGELRLRDGHFTLVPAGIDVNDVEMDLRRPANGSLRLSGTARSGDGALEFDGGLSTGRDASEIAQISIRGSDVELLRLAEQSVTASPDVNIVFGVESTSVSGTLDIPAADITVDALPQSAARPSADVVVHREEGSQGSAERATTLDVAVSLGEDVRVAGYGLSTRVHGALDVEGSSRRAFVGTGRLELKDGEYEAFGQTLTIDQGELLFNGPLDSPQLNIRATREAGEVTAGVHLTGTPNDLRSTVFSEPAMRDGDALSYLLTGRPLSGASSSEGNTLNQAAFALGLSRAGAVTEQIRGTLGLETLTVEGGADSSRIVAGKRLGGRLFVEYGYGLIDQLGTLLLRFQINDRLVVETSSGSATTLDLVYSVKKD